MVYEARVAARRAAKARGEDITRNDELKDQYEGYSLAFQARDEYAEETYSVHDSDEDQTFDLDEDGGHLFRHETQEDGASYGSYSSGEEYDGSEKDYDSDFL